MQDYLETAWKQYELNAKVSGDEAEVEQWTTTGNFLHVELTCANDSHYPAQLPDNACVEVRLADKVYVADITDPQNIQTIASDRLKSYCTKPNAQGRVILQVDVGHPTDITAGTSLYYRIVNKDSLSFSRNGPKLLLNPANDDVTTDWKVFNISYRLHQRMADYDTTPPNASQSPKDVFQGDQFKPGDKLKGITADQIGENLPGQYQKLSDASAPANDQALVLLSVSADPMNPLNHVIPSGADASGLVGSFWDWLNPVNVIEKLFAKGLLDRPFHGTRAETACFLRKTQTGPCGNDRSQI